jgi:hypothetical protein
VEHAGPTVGGETVGGSSCGGELGAGRGPAEMISDRSTDPDREVLVERVGEHRCHRPRRWDFRGWAMR